MSLSLRLTLYSVAIIAGAIGGALLPLRISRPGGRVALLAFAAGVMLGASFFHMLPDAVKTGGATTFVVVPFGFLALFVLERFVITHTCEEPPECHEHVVGRSLGLAAFVGLAVHTLFDGLALGSAVTQGIGFSAFIAIFAHKVPSSLSLGAILFAEGRKVPTVLAFSALLGLMVPVGALLYLGLGALVSFHAFSAWALAFSAGTFLYISVSDLLPHVNRHRGEALFAPILALLLGLALMLALGLFAEDIHA